MVDTDIKGPVPDSAVRQIIWRRAWDDPRPLVAMVSLCKHKTGFFGVRIKA